jgi:ABC-type multidrug transport system fused ATPase/permease subunit
MLQYLRKYRKECILAPLFKMLEALFDLLVPLVVASIIDRGIGAGSAGHVWRMCALLIALGLVGLGMAVVAQFFAAKAATGFAADVRHALFSRLTALSFPDVDRVGVSAMMTRMTSDVNQAQTGVNMALRLLLRSPFVVLGAMVMAFTIDARCALIFLAVIAALGAVVAAIMKANIPMMQGVQRQLETVLAATRENLTGVRVIRAFRREDAQYQAFRAKNRALTAR